MADVSNAVPFDVLDHVKIGLGITDDFHNSTLQTYIDEVREYLMDAGVPESVTTSKACGGIILRGVADLWNYGSGGAALSPYFHMRAAQLALKWGVRSNGTT